MLALAAGVTVARDVFDQEVEHFLELENLDSSLSSFGQNLSASRVPHDVGGFGRLGGRFWLG